MDNVLDGLCLLNINQGPGGIARPSFSAALDVLHHQHTEWEHAGDIIHPALYVEYEGQASETSEYSINLYYTLYYIPLG